MIAKCAMCGRPTEPYAWIGAEALGPKCARKIGIVPSSSLPKGSAVRFSKKAKKAAERVPETMDLFEELEKKE